MLTRLLLRDQLVSSVIGILDAVLVHSRLKGRILFLLTLCAYLGFDSVELLVLTSDLSAHVDRHVSKIADHACYLLQILVHLVFACVLGYSTNKPMQF